VTHIESSRPVRRTVSTRRRELRDVRHRSRPELRVERVLVAPSGIYVISTEADLAAAQRTAQQATELVRALVHPRYRAQVRGAVSRPEATGADVVEEVLVTAPDTLEHVVGHSPVVLSTSEVTEVAMRLTALTEPFPIREAAPRRRPWHRWALAGGLAAASTATAVALGQDTWSGLGLW
jgi:hypothetical protein